MPNHRALLRRRGEQLLPSLFSLALPRQPDPSGRPATHTLLCAQTSHIATLMNLPLQTIEDKLSHMILDKKFRGTLDAGAGCLIVYEEQSVDSTYDQALETLTNMGRVVDALYLKAGRLATVSAAPNAPPSPAPVTKA